MNAKSDDEIRDEIRELVVHYAAACKGNKQRAILMALDAGFEFTRVVGAMGREGVQLAFNCIMNGWISKGQLTDAGRAQLQKDSDA